jgi:hypothetical protein
MLHFGGRLTQTVGSGGTAVNQLVVHKAVARFLIRKRKDFIDRPLRSGARRKVEIDVVFILVEPGIQQEWLELHVSTSKEIVPHY